MATVSTNSPPASKKLKIDASVQSEEPSTSANLILQFRIDLIRGRGAPKIWRRFQVPANYTFCQFHVAIQKTMGWMSVHIDYHLHAFEVKNPSTGVREAVVAKEDLQWRKQSKDEEFTNIIDYFKKKGQKGKYEYDFGMCWCHEFVFEKAFEAVEGEIYPKCVAGAKACPLEDGNSDEEYDSDAFDPNNCFN